MLLSRMGLNDSHEDFHFIEKVVPTCLQQHGQRHACKAQKRKVTEFIYVVPHRFSSLLNYLEKFVHGNLDIILEKSGEELGFQVNLRVNGSIR